MGRAQEAPRDLRALPCVMAGHDSRRGSTSDVPGTCFSSIIAIITAHRWCGDGPPCFYTAPCSNTPDPSGVSTRSEQTPRAQGTVLQDCPHFRCPPRSPAVRCTSDHLAANQGFPGSPRQVQSSAMAAPRTQGSTVLHFAACYKGCDEGYQRAVSWGGTWGEVWDSAERRSFCPRRVGVGHPPGTWVCSPPQKFSEFRSSETFMEASSRGHHWY